MLDLDWLMSETIIPPAVNAMTLGCSIGFDFEEKSG